MSDLQPKLVGARIRRVEDPRLLTGQATYVDDVRLPGTLEVAFLRSSLAHADIENIDTAAARAHAGVHDVVTAADLSGSVTPIVCDVEVGAWQSSAYPVLADGRVRFVGEPMVAVVADSRYIAEDAVEEIVVSYRDLEVLATVEQSLAADAAPMHPGWKQNWFAHKQIRVGDVDGAFANAFGVAERSVSVARHTGMPVETRACIGHYQSATGELVVWSTTQMPHIMRTGIADHLGIPEHRVRVIAPDVGGGFGVKAELYPEELLVAALSMRLGRPVKWVEDRREHLVGTIHAREHHYDLAAAYDEDGRIRGLRATIKIDGGAYSVYPYTAAMEPGMAMGVLPGMYAIDAYECDAFAVATNKTPLGPYRGVARPSACFAMERIMDAVAQELRIDPVEIRRRNLIPADEMPFTTVTGLEYDSGDFAATFDKACELLDYEQARRHQAAERRNGRYLGIGVGCYVEQTAHGTTEFVKRGLPINFGFDSSRVRMDPSGHVVVHVTSHSHGQGHETSMAQIVADVLDIGIDDVRIKFGDTQDVSYGAGTLGSRSITVAGGASHIAATQLREKLMTIAAHVLEANPDDLELVDKRIRVVGSPSSSIGLQDLARWAHQRPERLPEGVEPTLEVTATYGGGPGTGAFSNAVHLALVEVDPTIGKVTILRYVVAEDCGRIVNPMIVDGQIVGGVAQGIGGALLEEIVYDDQGQPLTTTLMDYLMPTAQDVPRIEIGHLETLSPLTIGGIKGMGEGGAIAPGAAVAAAVEDALRPLDGGYANRIPLSPERVLALIGEANNFTKYTDQPGVI